MTENAKAAQREPLVRIVKRGEISRPERSWLIRALAALGAVLTGAPAHPGAGAQPPPPFTGRWSSAPRAAKSRWSKRSKIAIPLLGAAVAIAPAFKMKFWNIGAEGQIMAGAIAASYFALFYSQSLPRPLLLAVMLAGGAGRRRAVRALFRPFSRRSGGTNETLFTLMLNYIILGFEQYPAKRAVEAAVERGVPQNRHV